MGKHLLLFGLLLVIVNVINAQEQVAEDAAPDAPVDDASGDAAGDAAGKAAGEDECEEAWQYVEFIKDEVITKVTEIATSFKDATNTALEKLIGDTMEKVMNIRASLLERIKKLRKGEEKTCPEQNIKQEQKLSEFRMEIMSILLKLVDADSATVDSLKEIGNDLLKFKSSASQEVMRLLMLPENKVPVAPQGDCSDCDSLKDLSTKLETLFNCATEKEDEADAETEDQVTEGDDKPAECVPSEMYSMELITANEDIDKEIASLYTLVRNEDDPAKKDELFKNLRSSKQYRDQIEEIIVKLINEKDGEEKLKKIIERNLRRLMVDVQSALNQCLAQCGPGGCGDSCGARVLDDTIAKMQDYKAYIGDDNNDEQDKKEFVRAELIKLINENNDDARNILITKANLVEGDLDQCDQEKFDVYSVMKGPMWMLVNTTIFGGIGEIEVMVDAMIDQLEALQELYCGSDPVAPPSDPEGPNCEWEEYQQSKLYLEKLDEIIQDSLFKAKEDKDKVTAIIGLVDIQKMFDQRVKRLFEEELRCPDEVTIIKKEYMGQLNTCMAEFMNPKVLFSKMSRQQRISCIKILRNSMEDRSAKLLQYEFERSLSGINETF